MSLTQGSKVEWADIDLVDGKYVIQRGYRVKGGTIIATQLKQLQVQDKYQSIWEVNNESKCFEGDERHSSSGTENP